jgi:hypothetical protein
VLAAWDGEVQTSTETADFDIDGSVNEANFADVSEANVTHVEYLPVDPDVFNLDIASSAVDSAFVYTIASSMDARTKTGVRMLAHVAELLISEISEGFSWIRPAQVHLSYPQRNTRDIIETQGPSTSSMRIRVDM